MGRAIVRIDPSFNDWWEQWLSPDDLDSCPVCGGYAEAEGIERDADGDCVRCGGWLVVGTEEQIRLASIPEGDGYQLWETTSSHGSPLTPVFATTDKLIDYLVETGDKWDGKWPRKRAVTFVKAALAELSELAE